jgi:lipid-A-disaccharide synthase
MIGALEKIMQQVPSARARMILPNEQLATLAKSFQLPGSLETQVGGLADALSCATLAIASTGTVTMECAYFGVPAIAMYKTSWATFQIGKRLATVKYMAMPNILADAELFPEFIQDSATPSSIANAAITLLQDEKRRAAIKERLATLCSNLGSPGAAIRAARAVLSL